MQRLALVTIFALLLFPLLACSVVFSSQPPTSDTDVHDASVAPEPTDYATSLPTYTATISPPPPKTPAPRPSATPSPTATAEPPPPVPTPTEESWPRYVVVRGDTLSEIAARFGTSVDAIARANGLADPDRLSIGQELIIPDSALAAVPTHPTIAEPSPLPASTDAVEQASTPAPEPTAVPTAQPASIRESTVTLNLADYQGALVPLQPEQVGYPYDGLDHSRTGPPAARQFRALVLENAFLEVTIVPDLGGRIYQITDKVHGLPLLYNNPATIASTWGMRGWWLAVGGIEWALPTEEHGLAEYLPWQATVEQAGSTASVVLSFEERLTGVTCRVRVSLDEHAYVKIEPTLANDTGAEQRLQFWINAAYSPGGRQVPADTRVLLPARQVRVHDTSDPGLPGPGQVMPWPYYGPRDMSLLSQWQGYLGAFAHPGAVAGWMGAQSPGLGGLIRVFPPESVPGAKFFGLGDIPYSRYSLEPSAYLELWGGWSPTFWDYRALGSGESVTWEEYWYPLPEMGPVAAATRDLALSVGDTVVELAATAPAQLEVEAYDSAGVALGRWRAEIQPGLTWRSPSLTARPGAVQVRDPAAAEVILAWRG
ncbi:MAG: DUF5107 domain-containing protein [Anaerolineae bacterium]|nr:DUF5107 domain-containing protein [Anaerolineae bacterium]